MAQLNPVPVGVGVALLLLLIGLFALQRRRAQVARRARWRQSSREPVVAAAATTAMAAAEAKRESVAEETETVASPAPVDIAATSVAPALPDNVPTPKPAATDAQNEHVSRTSEEVKKLMAGGDYDQSIIASDDRYTRQLVGAELSSALVGRNLQRRERARAAFMNHGYFDDATRDLRIGESANERAAAARRLSFVRDREATPHLIGALDDSEPDVRRAAVEALMDLRDPAAVSPLNALLQTEKDRRVPRNLIKHAVEACATSDPVNIATPPQTSLPSPAPPMVAAAAESEREVIEI